MVGCSGSGIIGLSGLDKSIPVSLIRFIPLLPNWAFNGNNSIDHNTTNYSSIKVCGGLKEMNETSNGRAFSHQQEAEDAKY